jgi:hypothetical protein
MLIVLLTAGMIPVSPAWSTDSQGINRALLIGINNYESVPKLHGALNDVETIRHILLTKWGFVERNITVLTDKAATRIGMLTALEQFVKETGPHDTVYVHYSGHGSQVEDLSGDEQDDQLDETLVPQDGRTGEVRDITDDELDAIFSKMHAKTALITLDSCHSGTATRSLDMRTRSIPRDTRIDLYKTTAASAVNTRAIVPVLASRYVVMTGAASHQDALDGPIEGRHHGFFTYALSKSLSKIGPGASPRDIFSGVEREMKRIQILVGRNSMPEPQLEIPPHLMDTAVLGTAVSAGTLATGDRSSRLPWLTVVPTQQGNHELVILVNGSLLGATAGSTWALYPSGETRFAPGQALAMATVTQVSGKDVIAKVESAGIKIPPEARAISLLPATSGQRIPIRILGVPSSRRGLIEETLKTRIQDVDFVGPGQPARFALDIEGDQLKLLAVDGRDIVGSFELDQSWGAGVATAIARSINAAELLALDNPSSQLKVDARVVRAPKPTQVASAQSLRVVADVQAVGLHIRKAGEPRSERNSLQLEITVNADSYVTIADVDSEGRVNLLFPNPHQNQAFYGNGFIHADTPVMLPDSIKSGNEAGFYWDYSSPTGMDTIRVFTTTDLQTAQMLRGRIAALQSSTKNEIATLRMRSIAAGMHTLRQVLGSVATQGVSTIQEDRSNISKEKMISANTARAIMPPTTVAPDWAATSIRVMVLP